MWHMECTRLLNGIHVHTLSRSTMHAYGPCRYRSLMIEAISCFHTAIGCQAIKMTYECHWLGPKSLRVYTMYTLCKYITYYTFLHRQDMQSCMHIAIVKLLTTQKH